MTWYSLLLTNPELLTKKVIGRLRRRVVKVPRAPIIKLINGTIRYEFLWQQFLCDEDIRAILTDTYDLILCDYLKSVLSAGDTVIDVGANVGYISAVASSYVGTSGAVHGFEPLRPCFERLQVLSGLNPQFHLVFNNVALGDQEGILPITYDPDGESRNATLVPGKKASLTVPVPVKRLDKYILSTISSPERIKLIKIDVEGYEFPVLRGLEAFFAESRCRPLIVCEVKPWEIEALGYTMSDFEQYMRGFGYRSYDIAQRHKPVSLSQLTDMEVVLFRV